MSLNIVALIYELNSVARSFNEKVNLVQLKWLLIAHFNLTFEYLVDFIQNKLDLT